MVPKNSEPFEDTIIAALRTDCEIKNMIANTIKELPVALLEIKSEAMNDDFLTIIKQKITAKKKKKAKKYQKYFHYATTSSYIVKGS